MSKSTVVFIVAIILIPAAVFSVAYYFSSTLKADITDLVTDIEKIEDGIMISDKDRDVSDSYGLSEKVNSLNKKWKKCSSRWCYFFDHEEIHQIEFMRSDLESEVENGEYEAALITASRMKCAFKMLSQHDALNVSNFF